MSWPSSAADARHLEPPGWYKSSPVRLTHSDICPSACSFNRLRTLNDGHSKELRGQTATFGTLREGADTAQKARADASARRAPTRPPPAPDQLSQEACPI
ncbi:hypothetical protein GCM10012286_61090 [Streptomyces lasiicapitis]|uniref:Uncharacterized protein n=1 Tax=Streptomyces lasiicapitis TaxID=1923961 RepID=A0ABQ2MKF9_9ACTN|nr:hypothetical protein GCM10012286_61090 [Streptomyces lasiicapitis]